MTATIFLPGLPNTGAGPQSPDGTAPLDWLFFAVVFALLVTLVATRRRWLSKG